VDLIGVPKFERLFRAAAGLEVDKSDLKRYSDFIGGKLHDLLDAAAATAHANQRDIIAPWDLPMTGGLRKSVHEFRQLDQEIQLAPILEKLATYPPHLTLSVEAEAELPYFVGALTVALARTLKILDPELENPNAQHWERVFQVFDLVL
jgi:hypothetical protein